ncbi:GIP [Symbiodinium natans]|uniref:GIP protein n=1 Tax=Symbiodinium natans TaxID=878477 RepID=A0A812RQA5_9DINO|nr:GIP [Symbiodinium natans]
MFKVEAENYKLSRPAEVLADFLSHDWGSSRWMKFLTMLIIYNSKAALIATFLTSLALGVARAAGALPDLTLPPVAIGYGVHLLFLCFWQRFRQMLCTCRLVFFDKLCIAQSPELAELKAKGILGLAAFLNHSKHLVTHFVTFFSLQTVHGSKVLWSPAYFSRLWCSYEVATWLTGSNEQKPIVVMPVHAGPVLLVEYVAWAACSTSFACLVSGMFSSIQGAGAIPVVALLVAVTNSWGVPLLTMEISLARHLLDVERYRRLAASVAQTIIAIPTLVHRDRKLVYIKLKEWYSRPGDVGEEYLDHFNNLVQTRLASTILGKMSNFIPRTYTFYMLAAANLPWLSDSLSRAIWQVVPAPVENPVMAFAHILLETWQHCSPYFLLTSRSLTLFVGVRGSGIVCLALLGLNLRRCQGKRSQEQLAAATWSTDTQKELDRSCDPSCCDRLQQSHIFQVFRVMYAGRRCHGHENAGATCYLQASLTILALHEELLQAAPPEDKGLHQEICNVIQLSRVERVQQQHLDSLERRLAKRDLVYHGQQEDAVRILEELLPLCGGPKLDLQPFTCAEPRVLAALMLEDTEVKLPPPEPAYILRVPLPDSSVLRSFRGDLEAALQSAVLAQVEDCEVEMANGQTLRVPAATRAMKRMPHRLPPLLLPLCVERWNVQGPSMSKQDDAITVPLEGLHLPLLPPSHNQLALPDLELWAYDLRSFIVHQGTLSAGHYVAYYRTTSGWQVVDNASCQSILHKIPETLKP